MPAMSRSSLMVARSRLKKARDGIVQLASQCRGSLSGKDRPGRDAIEGKMIMSSKTSKWRDDDDGSDCASSDSSSPVLRLGKNGFGSENDEETRAEQKPAKKKRATFNVEMGEDDSEADEGGAVSRKRSSTRLSVMPEARKSVKVVETASLPGQANGEESTEGEGAEGNKFGGRRSSGTTYHRMSIRKKPEGAEKPKKAQIGKEKKTAKFAEEENEDIQEALDEEITMRRQYSGEDTFKDGTERTPPGVPKQLGPAILSVLLDDLVEFNGVSFREVPIGTFRERYVGLYFARWSNKRCQEFTEVLRSACSELTHRFEVVLISCDTDDEEYEKHAMLHTWPTLRYGDYRLPLLVNHFEIKSCPALVVVDPNGIVITAEGVSRLENNRYGFPWVEPMVDTLWGDKLQGSLGKVLHDLKLPSWRGRKYVEYDVVALIIGEPWCPESRHLVQRFEFLLQKLEQVEQRTGDSDDEQDDATRESGKFMADNCVTYFVHASDMHAFRLFSSRGSRGMESIAFPSVRVADEMKRDALMQFFGTQTFPALCLMSPTVGWMVADGATWLDEDPSGICFPWLPQSTIVPGDEAAEGAQTSSFCDIVRELREEDVNAALTRGPVFVAMLSRVPRAEHAEAVATLRAAAAAYYAKVRERDRDLSVEPLELLGVCDSAEFQMLKANVAKPTVLGPLPKAGDVPPAAAFKGEALYRVTHKNTETRKSMPTMQHGAAPWNNPGALSTYMAQRAELQFYFCTGANPRDRTEYLLSKSCRLEASQLLKQEALAAAEERWDRTAHQTQNQLQHRARDAWNKDKSLSRNKLTVIANKMRSQGIRPQDSGKGKNFSLATTIVRQLSSSVDQEGGEGESGSDFDDDEQDSMSEMLPHRPRVTFKPVRKLTEQLFGNGEKKKGSALIIDLARGCYYLSGNTVDSEHLCQFLDGWYEEKIDGFDLGMVNTVEIANSDGEEDGEDAYDHYEEEDSSACDSSATSGHRDSHSRSESEASNGDGEEEEADEEIMRPVKTLKAARQMPCMTIFLANKSHAATRLDAQELYRALLNYCHDACIDGHNAKIKPDDVLEMLGVDEKELTEKNTYLKPVVEKFFFFGLLDGHQADEESAEITDWAFEPPPAEFLNEMQRMCNSLMRKDLSDMHVQISRYEEITSACAETFDQGLTQLRNMHSKEHLATGAGTGSLCMHIAPTRACLHQAMLDELTYYLVVQCPPPCFILLVGDLPPAKLLPWPGALKHARVHVLGNVPDLKEYKRLVCPNMTYWPDFEDWSRSCAKEDLHPTVAKRLAVPVLT
eukprot:TRINITY_DN14778_c0_g1_i1.p1 TRINITY_DN14778_c0_g1~~TRINITY_DN14778_c0_g1_i1.p1  ORF type:complete len:1291 (-),score=344.91 TRINITY_DN14778_c0_g1_i1:122-3994(-)